MTDIRALRLNRGLSLIDLAVLADIPAGRLAELEHGRRPLDQSSRVQLAHVFGVPAELVQASARPQGQIHVAGRWMQRSAYLLVAVILGLLWTVVPTPSSRGAASAAPQLTATVPARTPPPTPLGRQSALVVSATATPQASSTPSPSPTAAPPTATPRFSLSTDGPHGCPLAPPNAHVVITQGYAEGSHVPTNVWGAVDLAVDADGDGYAEPSATQSEPVAATLGGVARVFLGSWPGGNFVRIMDAQSGWSIAYAHLDSVAVADGQEISAGTVVGTTGSTGMASGPHLHYEVWHGDANVDPTGLIECR